MTAKYMEDLKRYQPNINDKAVAGIVKHLGIALKSKDASLVSCSSKDELERVRESWLKKKLTLTDADADLDKSLKAVCEKMKADREKSRVTFYYLLAAHYNKLAALG